MEIVGSEEREGEQRRASAWRGTQLLAADGHCLSKGCHASQ